MEQLVAEPRERRTFTAPDGIPFQKRSQSNKWRFDGSFLRKTREKKVTEKVTVTFSKVTIDKAATELTSGEVEQYGVVRIGDDIVVDLMKHGCGVTYAEAIQDATVVDVGVPFASPKTLWRMKQTVREKDIPDRLFLQRLLKEQGIDLASQPSSQKPEGLKGWLKRVFGAG